MYARPSLHVCNCLDIKERKWVGERFVRKGEGEGGGHVYTYMYVGGGGGGGNTG